MKENSPFDISVDLTETVTKVYDDAGSDVVKTLGLIPRAIRALFLKKELWIMEKEFEIKRMALELNKKLETFDKEKIVDPEFYIAVPALTAMAYSMSSDELRNMYVNLLSSSMNVDFKDKVHPSFVETIKQLSPIDAKNLALFKETDARPLANYSIMFREANGAVNYMPFRSYVFIANSEQVDILSQAVSISVLEKLNLIDVSFGNHVSGFDYSIFERTDSYRELEKTVLETRIIHNNIIGETSLNGNEIFSQFSSQIEALKQAEPFIHKGIARLTPMGKSFVQICLN